MIRVWVEAFPSTKGGRSVSAVVHAGPFESDGQALRELLGPAWITGKRVCVMGEDENRAQAAAAAELEGLRAAMGDQLQRLTLLNLLRAGGYDLLSDLLADLRAPGEAPYLLGSRAPSDTP